MDRRSPGVSSCLNTVIQGCYAGYNAQARAILARPMPIMVCCVCNTVGEGVTRFL